MQEGGGGRGGKGGGRLSKFSTPAKRWGGRVVGWEWVQLRQNQHNGMEKTLACLS